MGKFLIARKTADNFIKGSGSREKGEKSRLGIPLKEGNLGFLLMAYKKKLVVSE